MTDPDNTDSNPSRELASLKQEFDDLRQTVNDLRAERKENTQQLYQTLRGLGLSGEEIEANVRGLMDHGLTRRAAMLAVVGAVGGAGFMSGRVSAAASTSDSDGDIGTPSNPIDVFSDGIQVGDNILPDTDLGADIGSASKRFTNGFIDSVDAGTVTADDATIAGNISGGVERAATLGTGGAIRSSDQFSIADDGTEVIGEVNSGKAGIYLIRNASDSDSATISMAGPSVSILDSDGSWTAADTDGNNCVFASGTDLILKNRLGASKQYRVSAIVVF